MQFRVCLDSSCNFSAIKSRVPRDMQIPGRNSAKHAVKNPSNITDRFFFEPLQIKAVRGNCSSYTQHKEALEGNMGLDRRSSIYLPFH